MELSNKTIKELVDAAPEVGFNKFKIGEHTYGRYPTITYMDGRAIHICFDQQPEIYTEYEDES